MKKLLAVLLSLVMIFSTMGIVASASDLDDQIKNNANSIVQEYFPNGNSIFKKIIETFQKVFEKLAPTVCEGKAEVENFVFVQEGDKLVAKYSLTTDMNFSSLRTNILTTYEYRYENAPKEFTEWTTVTNDDGLPVIFTRFNRGYLLNASDNSDFVKSIFKIETISAGTLIASPVDIDDLPAVDNLPDGTHYQLRVILRVNNSNEATNFTSSYYDFVKGE